MTYSARFLTQIYTIDWFEWTRYATRHTADCVHMRACVRAYVCVRFGSSALSCVRGNALVPRTHKKLINFLTCVLKYSMCERSSSPINFFNLSLPLGHVELIACAMRCTHMGRHLFFCFLYGYYSVVFLSELFHYRCCCRGDRQMVCCSRWQRQRSTQLYRARCICDMCVCAYVQRLTCFRKRVHVHRKRVIMGYSVFLYGHNMVCDIDLNWSVRICYGSVCACEYFTQTTISQFVNFCFFFLSISRQISSL